MNVVRLPGIHHDGNVVLVTGSLGNLLINAGTSWYQALQVERITGQLGQRPLDRILLTSRRFPVSGGASHVSAAFGDVPVHIHSDGQAALETGDFFTTWANRYDSDMPRTLTEALSEEDVFSLATGRWFPFISPATPATAWASTSRISPRSWLVRCCRGRTGPPDGTCPVVRWSMWWRASSASSE